MFGRAPTLGNHFTCTQLYSYASSSAEQEGQMLLKFQFPCLMGGGAILLSKPCIAKGLVSSCCSAAKRRNTASAPCQNIHYHHGGPKTEDYHPSASQSLMTWKLTNSQLAALSTAGQLGKPTACNSNLAQIACLRKDMRETLPCT